MDKRFDAAEKLLEGAPNLQAANYELYQRAAEGIERGRLLHEVEQAQMAGDLELALDLLGEAIAITSDEAIRNGLETRYEQLRLRLEAQPR
jgi:hypothetical protein